MQGILNEIRYPVSAMFLLVVATGSAVVQQHRMEEAVFRVETAAVADLLQRLKTTDLSFLKSQGPDQNPTLRDEQYAQEQSSIRTEFDHAAVQFGTPFGAIEVIGQFGCQAGCEFSIPAPDGGTLYFVATSANDNFFKQKLKEQDESVADDVEASPLLETDASRKLFYVQVTIKDSRHLVFSPTAWYSAISNSARIRTEGLFTLLPMLASIISTIATERTLFGRANTRPMSSRSRRYTTH